MKNAICRNTYTALLFDADDTLLDFQASEYCALGTLFERMGIPIDDKARELYRTLNKRMWLDYEKGGITKEELCNTRFRILFEQLGRAVDGVRTEAVYRDALGQEAQLLDGALEVCGALGGRYEMYIVTNGVYETQIRRLAASGLSGFFNDIFVSEKIGCSKPSRMFFDYVFSALHGKTAGEMLIIGDSLTSDIRGGVDSGIDTCWFNPHGVRNESGITPTYEIASLRNLVPLLM